MEKYRQKNFSLFSNPFFSRTFFSFSSTSSLAGERLNKDYYFFFSKHLIFTFLALLIMIFFSILQTSFLKKIIIPLFALSFIFLALVPIVGVEVKGAKRWLDFYFFRLQPIEILKPLFILITVKILTSKKLQNNEIKYFLSFTVLICLHKLHFLHDNVLNQACFWKTPSN